MSETKTCGNCEFKRKYPHSTYYQCTKYNIIITTSPATPCDACLRDKGEMEVGKSDNTADDTIEVL